MSSDSLKYIVPVEIQLQKRVIQTSFKKLKQTDTLDFKVTPPFFENHLSSYNKLKSIRILLISGYVK